MIKNFVTQAEMKAAVNAAIAALEEKYHGVDDIYIQVLGAQEPAEKWGGTWELVSQGRMLIGANDDYPLGSTGGSADAVVVNHTHLFETIFAGTGGIAEDAANGGSLQTGYTGTSFNAMNSVTNSKLAETGESGTGKNIPPYLAVNIWHKISD